MPLRHTTLYGVFVTAARARGKIEIWCKYASWIWREIGSLALPSYIISWDEQEYKGEDEDEMIKSTKERLKKRRRRNSDICFLLLYYTLRTNNLSENRPNCPTYAVNMNNVYCVTNAEFDNSRTDKYIAVVVKLLLFVKLLVQWKYHPPAKLSNFQLVNLLLPLKKLQAFQLSNLLLAETRCSSLGVWST